MLEPAVPGASALMRAGHAPETWGYSPSMLPRALPILNRIRCVLARVVLHGHAAPAGAPVAPPVLADEVADPDEEGPA